MKHCPLCSFPNLTRTQSPTPNELHSQEVLRNSWKEKESVTISVLSLVIRKVGFSVEGSVITGMGSSWGGEHLWGAGNNDSLYPRLRLNDAQLSKCLCGTHNSASNQNPLLNHSPHSTQQPMWPILQNFTNILELRSHLPQEERWWGDDELRVLPSLWNLSIQNYSDKNKALVFSLISKCFFWVFFFFEK